MDGIEIVDGKPVITDLKLYLMNNLRSVRDELLKEADIKINIAIDNNQDTTKLRAYRQALRDFPKTVNLDNAKSLDDVVFPVCQE
jgi:hypothetical protein